MVILILLNQLRAFCIVFHLSAVQQQQQQQTATTARVCEQRSLYSKCWSPRIVPVCASLNNTGSIQDTGTIEYQVQWTGRYMIALILVLLLLNQVAVVTSDFTGLYY